MPADNRDRALRLAFEVLSQQGPPPVLFSVTIRSQDGSALVTYTARPGEFAGIVAGEGSAIEQAILAAASTTEPRTAKVLARRSGYAYNSHLRAVLTALVRAGRLQRTADGGYLRAVPGETDTCQEQGR